MIFHLVTRTHRREPLFTPDLRDEIASLTRRIVGRTDARLLAYVVMPNHLHVMVRQGQLELGAVMQPLLRRIAGRVQRHHGFEGAVFERRYRDRICQSAEHAREALVYIHLNPWRARLCGDDLAYPWMTHDGYRPGADPVGFGIDPHAQLNLLELFAGSNRRTRNRLCDDYLRRIQWRMGEDRARDPAAVEAVQGPSAAPPFTLHGDDAWRRHFAPSFRDPILPARSLRPDLRDYLDSHVARFAPGFTVRDLRGSWLPRSLARSRARLIRSAADRGYGTVALARYFDISPTTVSTARHAPEHDLD